MNIKPISFKATNVRLVKDFEIEFPSCGIVLFKGKNEIGKSTILEAMRAQFSGDNTTGITHGVVNGGSEATYKLPTGEIVLIRQDLSEGKSGSRFVLVDQDGNVKKKVSDIKDLFQFNPITIEEFIAKGSYVEGRRFQRNMFLDVMGETVKSNFLKLEEQESELYTKRTEWNNQELTLRNIVQKAKPSEEDENLSKQVDELSKKVQDAEKTHLEAFKALEIQKQALVPIEAENAKLTALNKNLQDKLEQYTSKETFYNNEIAELERKLTEKKAEKERELKLIKEDGLSLRKQRDEQEVKCKDLKAVDITLFEKDEKQKAEELIKVKSEYDKARSSQISLTNYYAQVHNHKEAKAEADRLDAEIRRLRAEKERVVLESDIPLKNVRLTPDGIEINIDERWLPFSEEYVSMSSLIIATAKIILMANKNLKVVLISRGESICRDRLQSLVDMAGEEDALFLVEKVTEDLSEIVCEIIEPNNG